MILTREIYQKKFHSSCMLQQHTTHDGVFFFWHIPTHAYDFCKKRLQLLPITPFSCKIQGMNGIPFFV